MEQSGRRIFVEADDGVPLAVWEYGPADAALTVLFLHGHCLHSRSWDAVRVQLERADLRIVCYDHRGHGASGHASPETYTVEQLGLDLAAVMRAMCPAGQVVLVGHSMGGMSALAYARLHPEMIGARVVGIALISTAARGLTEAGLGRYVIRRPLTLVRRAVRRAPRAMGVGKKLTGFMALPLVRHTSFGSWRVHPRLLTFATAMVNETSVVTMTGFLDDFVEYDESDSLALFGGLPVVIMGGTRDLMTPFEHSVEMANVLPDSELICLDGAGHSVTIERAADVAESVSRLVEKVWMELRSSGGRLGLVG
ncbi:alpha/beta fold hydrolase [Smaragdicoccus niigatensis]|uniref:alpha/beta fold hydrolase n=1 Tax=Smaragdicoccus niigatensis TaxID=359359 RepID=UPI0003762F63|nr:alpha/beta hydrolase [Smaragdicoccus niigatensis]